MRRAAYTNTRQALRSDQGFTLIELMVSVMIFAIVSAGAFAVLSASQQSAVMNDQTVQIQRNVRLAMDLIARDLRMTGYGNPAAGSLPGCTNHLNATDNAIGADSGPDSIAVMTVDQQIGTLTSAVSSGTIITVSNLIAGVAASDVLSLEGVFTASVSGTPNYATGQVTLSKSIQNASFPAGTPVLRLICATYSVTGADGTVGGTGTVFAPFQLLRNTTATASNAVPIVDSIEDLQLAYGIDTDGNGVIDDQIGGTANVVDCLDFVPNNTACTQGTTLLAAGSVTTLPASINATPTFVRQIRITVVGRAIPPEAANKPNNCWGDKNFTGSSQLQAEDHLLTQPVFPSTCGALSGKNAGIRRRTVTRIVSLRDAATS